VSGRLAVTVAAAPRPAAPELLRAVVAAASGRCECAGQCGSKHRAGGGHCPREDSPAAPLHAIARDPAASGPAQLAADGLMAVCASCHGPIVTARESAARRAAAAALVQDQGALW